MIDDRHAQIGYFAKPHGIKGEIAASVDVDTDTIKADDFVFACIDGLDVPFRVLAVRPKGSLLLLTLKGVETEAEAAVLSGLPLMIDGDNIDEEPADEDAFYLSDLIGFEVMDSGKSMGRVIDYDDATDNYLLVVEKPDGSNTLIPIADDLVNEIDSDRKIIDMDLPLGLDELTLN